VIGGGLLRIPSDFNVGRLGTTTAWSEGECSVSHSSELQRAVRRQRALAERAEGGACASEEGEGAQRRERHPDRMFLEGGVSDRRRSDRWLMNDAGGGAASLLTCHYRMRAAPDRRRGVRQVPRSAQDKLKQVIILRII